MSNYYAVRHGRTPGIYYSWDACNQQIHKFSGAIFKGFKNLNEAQNFISVGHTDNNSNDNNGIVNQIIPGRETMSSLLSTAHNGGAFSTTFSATRGVPSLFASTSTEQAFASATQPQIALPSSSTQIFHPSGTNTNTMNSNVGLFGSRNANSLSATSSRNMHTARSAESSGPVDQIQSVQTIDEYDNANLKVPMARDTIVIYVDGGCDGNQNVHTTKHPAGWGVVVLFVRRGETEETAQTMVELFGPVVVEKKQFGYIGADVCSNNTAELTALGEALLWLRDHCPLRDILGGGVNQSLPVHIRFDSEYATKSVIGLYNGPKNVKLIKTIRLIYNDVLKKKLVLSEASSSSSSSSSSSAPAAVSASVPPMSLSELNEQSRKQRAQLTDLITQVSRPLTTTATQSVPTPNAQRPMNTFALKFTHVKGHSNNVWNDFADTLAHRGKLGIPCSVGRYASVVNSPPLKSSSGKGTKRSPSVVVVDLFDDDSVVPSDSESVVWTSTSKKAEKKIKLSKPAKK